MYRVIVVDDEPAALAHLCSVVKRCPGYKIIDTAENGVEGLEKVIKEKPDLLISDVKMPLMDGIELVSRVKQHNPSTYSLIVSGYQDFEYVRGAIQSGVCDYILKPVMPDAIWEILGDIREKLKADYYQARNDIIRRLCNGAVSDRDAVRKYFPCEKYYRAIIRRNGLPRRFSVSGSLEIYSDINESMTIYGRDEMESLYLIPRELLLGLTFQEYIKKVKEKQEGEDQYLTMVYDRHSFSVEELPNKVKELYRCLDTVSVVGHSQVIDLSQTKQTKEIVFNHEKINYVVKNLEELVRKQQYDKLKKELTRLYGVWEEECRPQLWLEYVSRQIIYIVRKHGNGGLPLTEYEYMLEDAFYYAATARTLRENLFDIIFCYAKEQSGKVDTPESFEKVTSYLKGHLDENITLQGLCLRFSVSQTYMSKLFRKYTKESFNRYVTEQRMKKAIALMQENKDFYIKDVASMVGYQDQFYFSRIFRAYSGQCPSNYIEQI